MDLDGGREISRRPPVPTPAQPDALASLPRAKVWERARAAARAWRAPHEVGTQGGLMMGIRPLDMDNLRQAVPLDLGAMHNPVRGNRSGWEAGGGDPWGDLGNAPVPNSPGQGLAVDHVERPVLASQLAPRNEALALRTKSVTDWGTPDGGWDHTSQVAVVEFEDGTHGYFKPSTGEDTVDRSVGFVRGELWRNELAVHEIDQAMSLRLTAPTTECDAPVGPGGSLVHGSLAAHLGGSGPALSDEDCQAVAVLHYVSGNTDGHGGNLLRQPDGRPGVIDGGLAVTLTERDSIRSLAFPSVVGRPLNSELVALVQGTDVTALRSRLSDVGIPGAYVDGVIARLEEVKGGAITGEAFAGKLVDGDLWTMPKGLAQDVPAPLAPPIAHSPAAVELGGGWWG